MQWRRVVIDTQVAILQHSATGVALQQKRQQTGGIVAMDAVAVLRRITLDTQAGAHLILQPGSRRIVQPAQAHTRNWQAAIERQLLGFEHHLPRETGGLSG